MKVVILAGGLGTRLSEETQLRPKPMVEVGGRPILWHIMKIYSHYGFNEFIICCGYKGYVIKEYFSNFRLHNADVTFDMVTGEQIVHQSDLEPWRITLVETGGSTETGGRIRRVAPYLEGEEIFGMTYGDAVADIDLTDVVALHRVEGLEATVTAVRPPARFGALEVDGKRVTRFEEKPLGGDAWVNGGFFVLSTSVLNRIGGDATIWEHEPLEKLAADGQLSVYRHAGFWHAMDTMRDRNILEELWNSGNAPWHIWSR